MNISGADAEKFLKTPHCELVEGTITKEIGEYLLRSWLFNVKIFIGNDIVLPVEIPPSIIENGWSQVINESGHGVKLVKNGISIVTRNLPPLPLPTIEDIDYNPTEEQVDVFLNENNLVLNSQNINDNFIEYTGIVEGSNFEFKIIIWNVEQSLLRIYLKNQKIAKCVIGYFNFALSEYLNNINFSQKVLQEELESYNEDINQTSFLDCLYDSLLDIFVEKHVSIDPWETIVNFSEMLPPPRNLYRNGKLYLNIPSITTTESGIDTILFRLKLQAKLFMKYNLETILTYYNSQSIPGYFNTKEDFTKEPGEIITTPENSFRVKDTRIIYTHLIMNQQQDYMWRNKVLTNNKICISRTFDAGDPMVQNKLNTWLDKFSFNEVEEMKQIIIEKYVNPKDFKVLSPKNPILIIVNDGVSALFIPVIEFTN